MKMKNLLIMLNLNNEYMIIAKYFKNQRIFTLVFIVQLFIFSMYLLILSNYYKRLLQKITDLTSNNYNYQYVALHPPDKHFVFLQWKKLNCKSTKSANIFSLKFWIDLNFYFSCDFPTNSVNILQDFLLSHSQWYLRCFLFHLNFFSYLI